MLSRLTETVADRDLSLLCAINNTLRNGGLGVVAGGGGRGERGSWEGQS